MSQRLHRGADPPAPASSASPRSPIDGSAPSVFASNHLRRLLQPLLRPKVSLACCGPKPALCPPRSHHFRLRPCRAVFSARYAVIRLLQTRNPEPRTRGTVKFGAEDSTHACGFPSPHSASHFRLSIRTVLLGPCQLAPVLPSEKKLPHQRNPLHRNAGRSRPGRSPVSGIRDIRSVPSWVAPGCEYIPPASQKHSPPGGRPYAEDGADSGTGNSLSQHPTGKRPRLSRRTPTPSVHLQSNHAIDT